MSYSLSFISHLVGALGFLGLGLITIIGWRRRDSGRALIIATFITAAWSLSIATQTQWGYPSFDARLGLENLRNLAWAFLLLRILGLTKETLRTPKDNSLFWLTITTASVTVLPLAIRFANNLFDFSNGSFLFSSHMQLLWQIAYTILGLALIEQVLRNTKLENRWQMKFLCLALGLIIGYDFFLYSHALLYNTINASLWDARGFVNALAIPLILISCQRNRSGPMRLNLSRDFTFHTTIFLGAGLYLILMAAAAYYIRTFGGHWAGVIEVTFLILGGVLLLILVFSGSFRAKLRVFLSQHLFSYKYDYRKEWLRITDTLSGTDNESPLQERVIHALAKIVDSRGGELWTADENGHFNFQLAIGSSKPPVHRLTRSAPLIAFFLKTQWVIDLNELRKDPELYGHLQIPEWLNERPETWLITPLMLHDSLYGFIVLNKSQTIEKLNWEDHDIIKVAGRQAASALSQLESSSALARANEFDAFNQLSAFIVHDIKTLVSQLSLMVSNAEKHKTNPAFIDDMIKTTDHSVNKMTRLLGQLSETGSDSTNEESDSTVELNSLLIQLVQNHQNRTPQPILHKQEDSLQIQANKEKLLNVLSHLVKNAQEACETSDTIEVSLSKREQNALVTLRDTGSGMSQSFIDHELFQPFKSTKGVSGMGIGVYQCQQYIIKLGGKIDVSSCQGKGSEFTLTFPLAENKVSG